MARGSIAPCLKLAHHRVLGLPEYRARPRENLDRYLRLRVVFIGFRLELSVDERKAKIGLLCFAARGWGCHRGVPKSIEQRSGDGTTL